MDYSRTVDSLTAAYNSVTLVTGREKPCQCPAGELAAIISSSVSAGLSLLLPGDDHDVHGECRDSSCPPRENSNNMRAEVELACVGLSLVEKIASKLMMCDSGSVMSDDPHSAQYLWELWRELFQRHQLMATLVQCFRAEDRMVSHLAAKSASISVICELHYFNSVNLTWQQKCTEVFQRPCPCEELDACIWSLTSVLKTLLKASEERKTEKLLVALDPVLSVVFSKLLPEDEEGQRSTAHRGETVCIFLDLLEVLTASRSIRGTRDPLPCQRLVHSRPAALLGLVDLPAVEYLVKKRALLLLKRTLLQRAGEDMMTPSPSTGGKGQQLCHDMTSLAEGVVRAVNGGLLHRLPVQEAWSSFGGSSRCRRRPGGGAAAAAAQPSDHVMLRAVSLVLVKSLELTMRSSAGPGPDYRRTSGYQQALLAFLRDHQVVPPGSQPGHPCSWLSQVFGDQDDDLMEAAKSLLLMSSSSQFPGGACGAVLTSGQQGELLCASGSNPHCHFLRVLRGVAFDHSVLLDFLISSETCFLEYCVRFLKHLVADRHGFLQACQRVEKESAREQRSPHSPPGGSTVSMLSREEDAGPPASSVAAGPTMTHPSVRPGASAVGTRAEIRLVDYDGSSEEESGEDTQNAMEVQEAGEQESWSLNQTASVPPTGMVFFHDSAVQVVETAQRVAAVEFSRQTREASPVLFRVLACLSSLRQTVARLHAKRLFPYNPTSLLRLLERAVHTLETSETLETSGNPGISDPGDLRDSGDLR